MPREDARGRQRAEVLTGLGVRADPLGRQLGLGRLRGEPLAVRQHHRAHGGGDQQRRGDLEGEDVLGEQDVGERLDVAVLVDHIEADRAAERELADADHERHAEDQSAQDREQPLASDRLDHRVGGVDADQHQHEEEQHQDRAGVDDDLHREEERRLQGGVQDRQRDHHDGQQQRGVHGLAHEQDPERGQHHDRREDVEGDHGAASPISGSDAVPVAGSGSLVL